MLQESCRARPGASLTTSRRQGWEAAQIAWEEGKFLGRMKIQREPYLGRVGKDQRGTPRPETPVSVEQEVLYHNVPGCKVRSKGPALFSLRRAQSYLSCQPDSNGDFRSAKRGAISSPVKARN